MCGVGFTATLPLLKSSSVSGELSGQNMVSRKLSGQNGSLAIRRSAALPRYRGTVLSAATW
jgi:hypothetical protein